MDALNRATWTAKCQISLTGTWLVRVLGEGQGTGEFSGAQIRVQQSGFLAGYSSCLYSALGGREDCRFQSV